jgi:cell wall-associated NlpC family hydrolase
VPLLLITVAAALLAAAAAHAVNPSIAAKRAEAQAVLNQINSLDAELEKAVQAYDDATYKLGLIKAQQKVNAFELGVARRNLRNGERMLADRVRAIYLNGDDTQDSTLEIILGSTSLDDLLNRLDTVNRVSAEDATVIKQVKRFRVLVAKRALELKRANAEQSRVVAARAAARTQIEQGLAERHRMLAGIQSEIARLQAEERAAQARLAAEVAARLQAQKAAQQRALQETVVGPTAVAADPQPQTTVAPPSQYGGVVGVAMQYLGTPYVWGGSSPGGFDCSGLVMYAYQQVGVSLPHSSYAQWNVGVPVSRDQLEPGDLVFFDGLGHVGIYIGNGEFIHAPHTGDVVKISNLNDGWYSATYVGARRVTG